MKPFCTRIVGILCLALQPWAAVAADHLEDDRLQLIDVFQLQYASDPRISLDGKRVVYVRNFMDIMKDVRRSNLWVIDVDGKEHRPLTTGKQNDTSPRWSPDGKRLLYISTKGGSPQIFCRWMDTGQTAKLTDVTAAPSNPVWAPDGKSIAFAMHVAEHAKPFIQMPQKPEGATWAEPPKVIRKLVYRRDGEGYSKDGHLQLFVLPSRGGAPRQLTKGPYDHQTPCVWALDAKSLIFSANRHPSADHEPLNTEIYQLTLDNRAIKALTKRQGPDEEPALSPDGKQIAYVGFDDERKGYQSTHLYVMTQDGTGSRLLADKLDREIRNPTWNKDGSGLYFQYDDAGTTKIGFVLLKGDVETVAANVGGLDLGRPYSGGSFSVGADRVAFTLTSPYHPADIAVQRRKARKPTRLTALNDGLLGHKELGKVEEIWYKSSHDGRKVQGWIVKPPRFDPKKKYPLILEIHGGPYANYGARFTAEIQLYAAAGYVVFYANPRGSTGYGEKFTLLIDHNYPGNDYDDLMSGVDAVIERGSIDNDNLFVTGGSGGGVLTAWIVGKTKRFRAAVASKPVINWYSWALTSDEYSFFTRYWFPGPPWEHAEHYLKRSPISLVGNVTTPTMLLTGEADFRTPISESEQFFQALKLRKVDTALVRVPGSSHDIGHRPSQMIAKVAVILKWFETYRHPR